MRIFRASTIVINSLHKLRSLLFRVVMNLTLFLNINNIQSKQYTHTYNLSKSYTRYTHPPYLEYLSTNSVKTCVVMTFVS